MSYRFLLLLSAIVTCSCNKYSMSSFAYTTPAGPSTISIVVPKGYKSINIETDSYGSLVKTYHYPSGASLYVAHVKDTMVGIQYINDTINQPQRHILGGFIYKGQEPDQQFWREIRRNYFRFGYKDVSRDKEGLFDSSTNQMSLVRIATQ